MSEKRVNIRITASTSDFDKAIKNAQQQIEKLADTIDNMGKGKFGDNLEKQLESVTDAAKKMQKQLEEMQESLDDMNKSKVDKLEKKLDDVSDSAEDLNEELEDTTDTLEDMNKAKVDKLKKQFEDTKKITETFDKKLEDVIDSLKDIDDIDIDNVKKSFEDIKDANQDLERRIDELLESFDDLDSQDLDRLQNELEQVQTDFRELGDGIKDSFGDLDRQLQDAADEMDYFGRSIEDIDYDSLDKLEENVRDLDKYIDESTESMKELTDIDTSEYEKLSEVMGDIGGSKNKFSLDNDSSSKDKSNKGSSFATDMATELLGANVAANKISDSIDELSDHLNDVVDSMREMNNLTAQEQVKAYDDLVDTMIKVQDEMDEVAKKQGEAANAYDETVQSIEEYKTTIRQTQEMIDDWTDKQIELEKSFRDVDKSIKNYISDLSDAEKAVESYEKKIDDFDKATQSQDDINKELQAINDTIDNKLIVRLEKLAGYFNNLKDEAGDAAKEIRRVFDYDSDELSNEDWMKELREVLDEFDTLANKDNPRVFSKVRNTVVDIYEELDKVVKLWKEFDNLDSKKISLSNGMEGYEEAKEALEELKTGDRAKQYEKERKELEKLEKEIKTYADLRGEFMEFEQNDLRNPLGALNNDLKKQKDTLEKLTADLREYQETLDKGNQVANDQADEINQQLKAYEKLSKRVREYLEDEEKSVLLREKVAKSFKATANAMEQVYAGSSKHNNADLITKTLKEAAEYVEKINLSSTKNLQSDLNRLGEIIEDKTDKIKRFKELSQEFDSKDSGLAYWLEQDSKALKDYANKVPVVVEAMDTLRKAWGDVSIGGEDNLKLRARAELLDDFADNLKKNVNKIKSAYSELESLDDIYDQATDEEKLILDDYKAWEKNKEALQDYNKAITEYIATIKQMGGQIDDKFLDGFGKLDFDKFVEDFDRMGSSSVVLQKQFNACKIELQEWLKTEKEARQEAVKHAEEALKQAKADKKAAESQEELAEATEKVKKSQEDLNKARENLKNFNQDASKNVKELNEMAEALRKIGMAAQDLGKEDIAKFDKSLASMLDKLKTFDNDIPKTLGDLKEDIIAVFADMDSLDFSDALGGLKDIGAGILGKLPTELKLAATAAVALAAGLKECAEIGINQFSKGMDTISNALSGITGLARDVGQELTSAFENITGMDMDLSSLIEIPINFESQMKRVGAIAGVTGEAFEELEKKARELGATTRYSATEVGEAMEYMGMAGWDNKEILAGLESVLNLATVADMSLGDASDFVTDALTALGMEAKDASKMVDILATVSVKSNTSVAQMQKAFTNCASVAGSFKIPLEDLAMALGLMANQGVKGAKAGTAMKNLMTELNNPTEKQLAALKKYNLLGARQAIVNGDLIGGIKELKQGLDGLSESEKNQVIEILFGKESLNGISALLNTTTTDINELEAAIKDCDGSASEMAKNFDDSLKGALLNLSSAMEETLLQIFDKIQDGIKNTVNELTGFFNILNGMGQPEGYETFSGLADALAYLEDVSEGWGEAIAEGLASGIAAIDNFVNGGALDSLLQVGTNIINGICDGIQTAADNGTLDSAISGAIRRIATWFSENLDTIVEVGKEIIEAISDGISENSDVIGDVIVSVIEMQTTIDTAVAKEKWKLIGSNLATFICEGFTSKIETFFAGVGGFLEGLFTGVGGFLEGLFTGSGGVTNNKPDDGNILDTSKDYQNWTYKDPITGNTYGPGVKNGKDYADGVKDGVKSKKEDVGNTVNQNFKDAKVKTDTTASEIGQGISDNIVKKLETMDTGDLAALRTEMENLQTTVQSVATAMSTSFTAIQDASRTSFMGLTNIVRNQMVNCTNIMRNQMINSANIVRNQCVNMANIFRNQFVSMSNVSRNQMINVSNIIRNQSVNWSNIIRNQITNARNAFTRQMMSMAAVARTQMINVSNILRNQSKSWYNIINNQAKNARNAFTSQMISMAKVAATQMGKVTSSIRSAMSQASRGISLNVNRNVTTSYAAAAGGSRALSADALYAANNASTLSLGGNMGALNSSASYAMSTGGSGSFGNSSIGSNVTLEIPVMLDGRELARASAKYVDNELKLMTKRENRKRGAK